MRNCSTKCKVAVIYLHGWRLVGCRRRYSRIHSWVKCMAFGKRPAKKALLLLLSFKLWFQLCLLMLHLQTRLNSEPSTGVATWEIFKVQRINGNNHSVSLVDSWKSVKFPVLFMFLFLFWWGALYIFVQSILVTPWYPQLAERQSNDSCIFRKHYPGLPQALGTSTAPRVVVFSIQDGFWSIPQESGIYSIS